MFSVNAAAAVIRAEGFGDNSILAILHECKDKGYLRQDGYISQENLNKVMKAFG